MVLGCALDFWSGVCIPCEIVCRLCHLHSGEVYFQRLSQDFNTPSMKYHGSARPSTAGKTIRLRTFSATLVYPVQESEDLGKRSRTPKETKGKYDRRRRLPHREWCLKMRELAKTRANAKVVPRVVGRTFVTERAPMDLVRSIPSFTVTERWRAYQRERVSLRTYLINQVFLQTWPARVYQGVQIFFERLFSGLCLECGNHTAEWGFWKFGCHAHAIQEISRLQDAASVVASVVSSLSFAGHDDFEALSWARTSLANLTGQYMRLQERIAVMWGGFAFVFAPVWLRRGYTLGAFAVDMTRLGVIAGSTDHAALVGKWQLPSKRQLVKLAVKHVIPRDATQVVRELCDRKDCGDLSVLLTDPRQFVLNSKRVQFLFSRLGRAELSVKPSPGVCAIKLTRDEADLLFVLSKLYQGANIPDFHRPVAHAFYVSKPPIITQIVDLSGGTQVIIPATYECTLVAVFRFNLSPPGIQRGWRIVTGDTCSNSTERSCHADFTAGVFNVPFLSFPQGKFKMIEYKRRPRDRPIEALIGFATFKTNFDLFAGDCFMEIAPEGKSLSDVGYPGARWSTDQAFPWGG